MQHTFCLDFPAVVTAVGWQGPAPAPLQPLEQAAEQAKELAAEVTASAQAAVKEIRPLQARGGRCEAEDRIAAPFVPGTYSQHKQESHG